MFNNRFAPLMEKEEENATSPPPPPDFVPLSSLAAIAAAAAEIPARARRYRLVRNKNAEGLCEPTQEVDTYTLERGTDDVVFGASDHITSFYNSTLRYVAFYGRCYLCQYLSHSQKHCPLRQCTRCKTFGHANTVCNYY